MGISQRPNVASKHVKDILFPTLKKLAKNSSLVILNPARIGEMGVFIYIAGVTN